MTLMANQQGESNQQKRGTSKFKSGAKYIFGKDGF
jgi:hypothetical protein